MTLLADAATRRLDVSTPKAAKWGLRVEGLRIAFPSEERPAEVVRGVSFAVAPRETLVLLGESGCGKSVSARALLRLHDRRTLVTGAVFVDDVDLLSLDEPAMRARRGKDIAFVPQDAAASLDPLRRVGAQIAEVLRVHGIAQKRRAAWEHAEACLRAVGIADPKRVARSFPHELSGGMRQRVLIALAVSCSPSILVADEPTTALDVTVQAQILELFAQLQADTGMGLLMVTHDVGVARQIADRVAIMYAGRIVEQGPARDVLDDPGHHYTIGLLGAMPSLGSGRGTLNAIPGRPPTVAEIPGSGCAFSSRCAHATDDCLSALPELVGIGGSRYSACPPLVSRRRKVATPVGITVGTAP